MYGRKHVLKKKKGSQAETPPTAFVSAGVVVRIVSVQKARRERKRESERGRELAAVGDSPPPPFSCVKRKVRGERSLHKTKKSLFAMLFLSVKVKNNRKKKKKMTM
jgi:hypothetical protein